MVHNTTTRVRQHVYAVSAPIYMLITVVELQKVPPPRLSWNSPEVGLVASVVSGRRLSLNEYFLA